MKKQNQDFIVNKMVLAEKKLSIENKQIHSFQMTKIMKDITNLVNDHKKLICVIGTSADLFIANRLYGLKKYHKKLPIATKQICEGSLFKFTS